MQRRSRPRRPTKASGDGFVPALLGRRGRGAQRQVATSMFAHGGWSHLVGNLVFLAAFAPRLEDRLGRAGVLGLYAAAGLAATALDARTALALAPAEYGAIPSIGAIGATSGVVGAYLVLHRSSAC